MRYILKLIRFMTGRLMTIRRLTVGDTVYMMSVPSVQQAFYTSFRRTFNKTQDKASLLFSQSSVTRASVLEVGQHSLSLEIHDMTPAPVPFVMHYDTPYILSLVIDKTKRMQTAFCMTQNEYNLDLGMIKFLVTMSPYKEELRKTLRQYEKDIWREYGKEMPLRQVKSLTKALSYTISTI